MKVVLTTAEGKVTVDHVAGIKVVPVQSSAPEERDYFSEILGLRKQIADKDADVKRLQKGQTDLRKKVKKANERALDAVRKEVAEVLKVNLGVDSDVAVALLKYSAMTCVDYFALWDIKMHGACLSKLERHGIEYIWQLIDGVGSYDEVHMSPIYLGHKSTEEIQRGLKLGGLMLGIGMSEITREHFRKAEKWLDQDSIEDIQRAFGHTRWLSTQEYLADDFSEEEINTLAAEVRDLEEDPSRYNSWSKSLRHEKCGRIQYIWQLVQMSEEEITENPHSALNSERHNSEKFLSEVIEALEKYGLSLNTKLSPLTIRRCKNSIGSLASSDPELGKPA